ncbi:uncharacterized protein [Typha angustifolia]|uniref:uncharacterized protein n=1 Tax=Typha angustifolia TaxID=59011 RepID=UPI003C2B80ED
MEHGSGRLVDLCIEAASSTAESVEKWRRQRRTLELLPGNLADSLLRRLIQRRLLYPSLLEVFQYPVEEIDLKGDSSIDAEWMAYLGAFRSLRKLNLADCRGINNYSIWPISGMSTLKELDLSRCSKITNAGIKHIISIQTLEKLYISETGVTDDGVMLLPSLTNLYLLDLGGIAFSDKALLSLQNLTKLEYLDMWGSQISNSGAFGLRLFPKLCFLNIAWTNVTILPYLPSIGCLNMSNCTIQSVFHGDYGTSAPLAKLSVSGASFADIDETFSCMEVSSMTFLDMSRCSISKFYFLDNMKGLEHLDLSFSGITDNTVEHIANVGATLRYLDLSNTKLTSHGVCMLAGSVIKLESFSLAHTAIDDSALSYISMMFSLRILDLSHTNIKGLVYWGRDEPDRTLSLCALQNLSHLESLNLEETNLTDKVLQPLASFKELKYLYLKSDFLSDITLCILSSLLYLKVLGFRGTVLTSLGLLHYVPPATLHLLDLRGCWLLTEDVIASFCRSHPQIEVKHEHIEMPHSERDVSVAPCHHGRTTQAHQLRQKKVTFAQAPYGLAGTSFVDERIKYSREELMELQHSGLSSFAVPHVTRVPLELQRKG